MDKLKPGDEIIIRDVWGAITYKGEGVFIAGGAGITPFISIFRDLRAKNEIAGNTLIFANKTKADIILDNEFKNLAGLEYINILSDEHADGYYHGLISEEFLKTRIRNFNRRFYLCGPLPMMNALKNQLANLGVGKNSIVLEF
jgi:ferredoxin-NADP reductase